MRALQASGALFVGLARGLQYAWQEDYAWEQKRKGSSRYPPK
jgi:hypothetical protein